MNKHTCTHVCSTIPQVPHSESARKLFLNPNQMITMMIDHHLINFDDESYLMIVALILAFPL